MPRLLHAEINTTLEYFAYWLVRDFPRVKELTEWALAAITYDESDERYERWWRIGKAIAPGARVRNGTATLRADGRTIDIELHMLPVADIQAFAMHPDRVTVVLQGTGRFINTPNPLDAIVDWIRVRFGVAAQADDERARELAQMGGMLELTDRLKDVADRTADGYTQKQIAGDLVISVSTVKNQRREITRRLGLGELKHGELRHRLRELGYGTTER